VDVDAFPEPSGEGEYFLAGGRLVGYKRVDIAIRAANLGRLPLVVFGDGPERRRLEAMAGPTVKFVGPASQAGLVELIRRARAYLFPGVEDFGILPVEAQAGGRPVVAFAEGGVLETVVHGSTGILLSDATPEAFRAGIERLGSLGEPAHACRRNAARFGRARFEEEIRRLVAGPSTGLS
jgi:glycosyltransferase involved in cell wall biosynthesis